MCFNPKFLGGPNLSFFGLGPWAIIHGIAKYIYFSNMNFDMIPFERSFSERKKFDIGSTEFKLWQLKKSPNH